MSNDWLNNNRIYFYIPQKYWPSNGIPTEPNIYWHNFGGGITPTVYAWNVQTYQYLKAEGLSCEMVGSIPNQGIIFASRVHIPEKFKPNSQQLVICLKAENNIHPYAQIHIVGNDQDMELNTMLFGDRYLFPGEKYYVPHWPQPGLIPRNNNRKNTFKNVAFLGESRNLDAELQTISWENKLNKMGLKWYLIDRDRRNCWNDFSYIDVIIAVRNLGGKTHFNWKPALKLYNAWLAGVPAILGKESAFEAERKSELDYIEVNSLDEVLAALKLLKDNPELRQNMIENGFKRSKEYSSAVITNNWKNLIEKKLIPAYLYWCDNPLYRQSFLLRRRLAVNTRSTRKNLQQLRNKIGIRSKISNLLSR